MTQKEKNCWFVLVTLLASVSLSLAVSCGSDDDDGAGTGGASDEETGGTSEEEAGGTLGASGSGGSKTMDSGTHDGSSRSVGTVQEGEVCTVSWGMMSIQATATGICKPTGTDCPGSTRDASDCAADLVCCVDTDQCDALAEKVQGSAIIQNVECRPESECPGITIMGMTMPATSFHMGCPDKAMCCPITPEGGISFEGGFPGFEGGFPGFEGGIPNQNTGDAGEQTVDAGEQTVDASN